MVTPDAERTMNTFLGISENVGLDALDESTIKQAKYVYLEGYLVTSPSAREAAIKMREIAEANGVKTALTFSDPSMAEFFADGLAEMIGNKVDLLFCNEEEAKLFTKTDNLDDAIAGLKQVSGQFAITRGANGALLFDGDKHIDIEPFAATAIDTNGAGDMFAGAFLYAITHGHDFAAAGKLASRASSEVVKDFGPRLRPEQHQEILSEIFS